jgi:uncharacterized membrane protein
MHEEKGSTVTAHRLGVFSDAVIAVIMTVMVLELRAPEDPAFSAPWPLRHTVVSYAVSYLFIAIIWINHHYLMGLVGPPTLRLIWINFAHPSWCRSCHSQRHGLRAPTSRRLL